MIPYRREIDGLRAIAVLPVIFFHAGFKSFSGGFVGVDVFFVISGYLITSLILSEKERGSFSIAKFYERRARRILPALLLVVAASIPFAWAWLLPVDMKEFSQSVTAVSVFASNILFWRHSGYFDSAAELKPLLHTWSLAVEEQYYVLYPLLILLAWRFGRKWIVAMLCAIAVMSLAIAELGSSRWPSAAFFLLPTRGWELLLGALVAFYLAQGKAFAFKRWVVEFAGLLGVALILYAVFAFSEETPFPGLYALIPTLGTALIIAFAKRETTIGRLLETRALVGLGLISYSAYLWHQPLFAFARLRNLEEPSKHLLVALIVGAILLAYISWRYVETPFRDKQRVSRKQILVVALACSCAFALLGTYGYLSNGFEDRFSGERRVFLSYFDNSLPNWAYFERTNMLKEVRGNCNFYDLAAYRRGNASSVPIGGIPAECFVRDRSKRNAVFIWGDSHAQMLYPGLKRTLPDDWQILQITSSGCIPKLDAKEDRKNWCEFSNWFAYRAIREAKPDIVVVAQNLDHNVRSMKLIAEALQAMGVRKIVFAGPSPHWRTDLPKIIIFKLWDNTPTRTLVGVDMEVLSLDRKLKAELPRSDQVDYVSIVDSLCNDGGCVVYLGDDRKSGITSWDYGHLTPIASYFLAKDVLAKVITDIVE